MAFLVAALAGSIRAAEVTVVRLDGEAVAGTLESVSEDAVQLVADLGAVTVPADEIASVQFASHVEKPQRDPECVVYLSGGGRLHGALGDAEADSLLLRTRFGDRTIVPFRVISHLELEINRPGQAARELLAAALADRKPGADVLIGGSEEPKAIRGTLVELGRQSGEFIFSDRTRRIKTQTVYGVVFASAAEAASQGVLVHLTDGQIVAGVLSSGDAKAITIEAVFGQVLTIPVGDVQQIEWRSSRVVHLSDLRPATFTSRGVVHESWPYRLDRSVGGEPMALGGRPYSRGVGVHAYSLLTYEIGGAYETFAATVGIDDAVRPAGSVEFIVIADGEEVLRVGPLSGEDEPAQIRAPIAGVKSLTLVVDYAEGADLGDWANWAAARLIKSKTSS
jgi:hypothetical protein